MSTSYINPALPRMIRGLYKADLREKSIQNMLDLAADLVQELIDMREQADREPNDAEVEAGCAAFYEGAQGITSWERLNAAEPALADRYRDGIRGALIAAQEVRDVS